MLHSFGAVGPLDVPPAFILSRFAVRERTMGARSPPLDWLRALSELRGLDRTVLARQFLEPGRHRVDGRDRARPPQRGGRRPRGPAVQRRTEICVLVDGASGARALLYRA